MQSIQNFTRNCNFVTGKGEGGEVLDQPSHASFKYNDK